ncbi:unnamed protein product [Paramecium pentaurelia]|uniref:Uncharacterized protein n=1 Tax=Paramecium pentaurelia TaxID=43138 RepID=A0A8S1YK04_9CILI|nr:unnamed protein product [Paramecium pentaurelia]
MNGLQQKILQFNNLGIGNALLIIICSHYLTIKKNKYLFLRQTVVFKFE